MYALTFSVAGLVALASAVNITFGTEANCGGVALYGARLLDSTVSCTEIGALEDAALSVLVSGVSSSQVVTFYSDAACTQQLTALTQDSCYTPDASDSSVPFGSFLITDSATATTDLVPYGVKLSNYKGLQTSPYNIDAIPLAKIVLGFSAIAIGAALTLSAAVIGCSTIAGPDPVLIYACVAVPVGSLLSHFGHALLARAGRQVQEHIEMHNGVFRQGAKRSIDTGAMNQQYMDAAFNISSSQGIPVRKIGYMKRDLGDGPQLSPVMEIDGEQGTGKWHLTAHYDHDIGGWIHHIAHGSEWDSQIDERNTPYTFDSIRWIKNGIDATFCQYAVGNAGFNENQEKIYQNYYAEMKCYDPKLQTRKFLLYDMYNTNGDVRSEAHMAPYKGTPGKSAIHKKQVCLPTSYAKTDSDCQAAGPS